MAELVTLAEDGPLGKQGEQVWVEDAKDVQPEKPKATKSPKSAAKKSSK